MKMQRITPCLLKLLLLGNVSPNLLLDVEEGPPRLLPLLHHVTALWSGKYATCNVNTKQSQAGNDAPCHTGSSPLSL